MRRAGQGYRADIDGLRAVAVIAVLLHHVWPEAVPGGFVGVDVFFVISGFLITRIIHAEIAEGRFSFARFYERRIRRLFPALFAMLGAVLVAGWFLQLPSDYEASLRGSVGTLLFSSNVVFWRQLAEGYFAADAKLNPLLHTWSLGVEEQFYLAFPPLLLLLHRFFPRHLRELLAGTAVLSLLAAVLLLEGHRVAVFFLTPFRGWELLAGSLLALNAVPAINAPGTRNLVATLGLGCILASIVWYGPEMDFPGLAAALPVLGACAVIHAGSGAQATATGRVLQWRWIVYVGLMSYSLYLWHWPILVFAKAAFGIRWGLEAQLAVLAASLAIGSASYHLIEQPSQRPGRFRGVVAASIAVALLVVSIAMPGLRNGGYPTRLSEPASRFDSARLEPIRFLQCDGRSTWCRLGADRGSPTFLLFGDSHMLVWGPGLDIALRERGIAAYFVPHSSCPPVYGVERIGQPKCAQSNRRVKQFLTNHPDVEHVVMAARWEYYERPRMIRPMSPRLAGKADVLQSAVGMTVSELRAMGREVLVLGQVPVYPAGVPYTLALEAWHGLPPAETTLARHHERSPALKRSVEQEGGLFVDPAEWMCTPVCLRQVGGVSLYKDKDHLSVAGSLRYAPQLGQALDRLLGGTTPAPRALERP